MMNITENILPQSILKCVKGRFLLTTALSVGLVAFSPAIYNSTQTANAQSSDSVYLQPISGWSVSKVGELTSEDGFCALTRRYSNSHMISIAQNPSGESSIGFEMGAGTFETGQSYNVRLSSNNVYDEAYKVTTQNAAGLVVKLGERLDLFKALQRTQNLSVSVDDANYNYQFTDFTSGYDQLQNCLGNEQGVTPLMTKTVTSEQMRSLRGQLGELQTENKQLLSELEGEKESFNRNIAQKTQGNERINELLSQMQQVERENADLLRRLEAEKKDTTQLRSRIGRLEEMTSSMSGAGNGAKDLAMQAAQDERAELMAMLEAEKARRQEIERIAAQKSSVEGQQSELLSRIAELEKISANLATQLADKNRDLVTVKNALADSVNTPNQEVQAAQQALRDTRQRYEELRIEKERIKKTLEQERDQFSRYIAQKTPENNYRLQQFMNRVAELEATNSQLMNQLSEKSERTVMLSEQEATEMDEKLALNNMANSQAEEEIERLKKMLAMERDERMALSRQLSGEAQSDLDNPESGSNTLSSMERRIKNLEKENKNLKESLNVQNTRLSAVQQGEDGLSGVDQGALAQARAQIAQKAQQLELVSTERDELKTLLESERERRMSMAKMLERRQSVTEEKTDLNAKLRSLEARNLELSRALDEAKNRSISSSSVREVGEMRAIPPVLGAGANAGRNAGASDSDVARIRTELEIALAERDEYRSLLQKERARLREVNSLRTRIGSVNQDQENIHQTIRDLQNEKIELMRALEFERAKLDSLPSDDPRRTAEPKLYRDPSTVAELQMTRDERDRLRKRLETLSESEREELELLERMLEKAQADEQRMKSRVANLEQEKQELQSLLSSAQRAANSARQDVSEFVSQNKDVANVDLENASNDTQRLAALEQENRRLYSEMQALQAQKSEAEALEAEVVSVNAQNEILRKELASYRNKSSKIVADEDMVAHLRGTIDRLSLQNENLQEALDLARSRQEQTSDENPYRRKLLDSQTRIQAVMADNASLTRELERIRSEAESKLLSAEQIDMDMQLATVRFREAEREIDRLSDVLRRERAKHREEVSELEEKLFDPAITDAEQLKRLKELEAEIDRLRSIQTASGTPASTPMPLNVRNVDPVDSIPPMVSSEPMIGEMRTSSKNDDIASRDRAPAIQSEQPAPVMANRDSRSSIQRLRERVSRRPDLYNDASSSSSSNYAEAPKNDTSSVDMASIDMSKRIVETNAPAPIVMDVETLPKGQAQNSSQVGMTPIMDGPGEAELAEAIRQGGGVFVSERQVVMNQSALLPETVAPLPGATQKTQQAMVSAPIPLAPSSQGPSVMPTPTPTPMPMPAQATMEMAPVPPVNNVQFASVPQQPHMMPAPVQRSMPQAQVPQGPNGQDIASLLVAAGIPMVSGFEKVNSVSNANFSAFRWDTGTVYGSAEKTTMTDMSQFNNAVEGYLRKTEARCAGSFDKTPSPVRRANNKMMLSYDIACVGNDLQGAGAALLFYYEDNMFNVIAHESGIEDLDQAMNTRDLINNILIR